MGIPALSTIALSVLFISGCSAADPPPPPPKSTVFDPLTHQIDRAKDVQNTVNGQAAETRDKIDGEERGDPRP